MLLSNKITKGDLENPISNSGKIVGLEMFHFLMHIQAFSTFLLFIMLMYVSFTRHLLLTRKFQEFA